MLNKYLRLDVLEILGPSCINKNDAFNLPFLVANLKRFLQFFNSATLVIVSKYIFAGERLEDVSLLEGTVELQDHIVFL